MDTINRLLQENYKDRPSVQELEAIVQGHVITDAGERLNLFEEYFERPSTDQQEFGDPTLKTKTLVDSHLGGHGLMSDWA